MDVNELLEKGTEHTAREFGGTSVDRPKIIGWLNDNGAGTPDEIGEALGLEPKLVKTKLDVMRRDGLVAWRDFEDKVFYYLTDDGKARAEGKTKKRRKK
jgi:DNA-binding MarR family transcriptional regulator